jgi:tripartite-type tricarboxylate transporter receptor subunit TctC
LKSFKHHGRALGICAAFLCLATALPQAAANGAEVSFKGKTVRMIVGSPPGGGTDLGGRLFSRFIGKYLPDSPNIITQNVPGASGIKAMNFMVQQVVPDGNTFIAGSTSQITPDVILKNAAVLYDPTKFEIIGGIASTGTVLVASKAAMERMAATGSPIAVAQVGGARTGAQMPLWGAEYLGWKIKWVSGYQGTAALTLAVLKGEADMTDSAGTSALQPLLDDGRFYVVVQAGVFSDGKVRRRGALPDVPTMAELIGPKLSGIGKEAFATWQSTTQIGKFFALPPGTPKDYVEAYREAYRKMGDDPEFQKAAVIQLDEDYVLMGPSDVKSIIQDMARTPEEHLKFLLQIREKYGLPVPVEEKTEKSKD